ncbi:peptidase inhibitor family I36 protein [Streptomyces sp. NPDC002446]
MKRVLNAVTLGAAVTALLGSVIAGPAQASGQGEVRAAHADGRYDCTNGWFCTWDGEGYRQNETWAESKDVSFAKCDQGSWNPRGKYLPRSAWNRTNHTWYGKDKNGTVRQTVRKKAMHGSLAPDLAEWKSITHWCWK